MQRNATIPVPANANGRSITFAAAFGAYRAQRPVFDAAKRAAFSKKGLEHRALVITPKGRCRPDAASTASAPRRTALDLQDINLHRDRGASTARPCSTMHPLQNRAPAQMCADAHPLHLCHAASEIRPSGSPAEPPVSSQNIRRRHRAVLRAVASSGGPLYKGTSLHINCGACTGKWAGPAALLLDPKHRGEGSKTRKESFACSQRQGDFGATLTGWAGRSWARWFQ